MSESKHYTLLRKLLSILGLSQERIDELIATIQSWLAEDKEGVATPQFPYHLRDDFLSPAEVNFYRVLQTVVSDWAIIFTKVSLGDLFFAQTRDRGQNQAYRNKIDRKHIDFLLCDPHSVTPFLGIELDDSSHERSDRKERDTFVDGVFTAAGLPIVHIPVKRGYPTNQLNQYLRQKAGVGEVVSEDMNQPPTQADTIAADTVPSCPKCGTDMVRRTAKSGKNAGKDFWGCPNYPRCRGIVIGV